MCTDKKDTHYFFSGSGAVNKDLGIGEDEGGVKLMFGDQERSTSDSGDMSPDLLLKPWLV